MINPDGKKPKPAFILIAVFFLALLVILIFPFMEQPKELGLHLERNPFYIAFEITAIIGYVVFLWQVRKKKW